MASSVCVNTGGAGSAPAPPKNTDAKGIICRNGRRTKRPGARFSARRPGNAPAGERAARTRIIIACFFGQEKWKKGEKDGIFMVFSPWRRRRSRRRAQMPPGGAQYLVVACSRADGGGALVYPAQKMKKNCTNPIKCCLFFAIFVFFADYLLLFVREKLRKVAVSSMGGP